MNRKQFFFVLIALAIIGGAGLVLLRQNKESWSYHEAKVGEKLFGNFRFNDVAAIHLKGTSDLHIVNTNGLWRIRERDDFPANYAQLKDLLVKMKDLKIVQSEQIGPSQLGRVDLASDGAHEGTLLEFFNRQGKILSSVRVGKMHLHQREESVPFGLHGLFDGRYVLLPAEPENVLLISDDLASATADPSLWLSREFFKFENVQAISLLSGKPDASWDLVREKESWPWTLAGAKPDEVLDAQVAADYVEAIRFLTFSDVLPSTAPSSVTGLEKPLVLTILTSDHFAYTLKIGTPPNRTAESPYYLTVAVSARLPNERSPATLPETSEEKKKGDEEFLKNMARLREKLARESELASAQRIFVVEPHLIESIVRERSQLLEKKASLASKTQ